MERYTGAVLVGIMNKVTLGVLLCLSSLILMHGNNAIIGIITFVIGIVLMNRGKRP
jgi:hypothetical protein